MYIHLPWCLQKCPYCDFNSHAIANTTILPEAAYCRALLDDFNREFPKIHDRVLTSIFIGGGTPSLFSPKSLGQVLTTIQSRLPCDKNIEITLEANPGALDEQHLSGYRDIGINRLSLGIQSFQDEKLRALGRIHSSKEAFSAIETAKKVGFTRINLDLMHGLPKQTIEDAEYDLTTAISCDPEHISWYQLTLEPNTLFYKRPPKLPTDTILGSIEVMGFDLLSSAHYQRYEVSAFTKAKGHCQHNLNYWQFGDYLGIGAGAHSKLSDHASKTIRRNRKKQLPKQYLATLDNHSFITQEHSLSTDQAAFEFMLNALRLMRPIPISLFEARTFQPINAIKAQLIHAKTLGLLEWDQHALTTTPKGRNYLNDLLEIFLK